MDDSTGYVLGLIIALCVIGLMYLFSNKSELETKISELQNQVVKTNNLLGASKAELAEKFVKMDKQHQQEIAAAAQKLQQLRIETCVALDNEISGYNQAQCKTNKTLNDAVDVLGQSSQTLLAALLTKYTSSDKPHVNEVMKLWINNIITMDQNIESNIDKYVDWVLSRSDFVTHIQRQCKHIINKYDTEQSELYKTLSNDQVELAINAHGTSTLQSIVGSDNMSMWCRDLQITNNGKASADCQIAPNDKRNGLFYGSSNKITNYISLSNDQIAVITNAIHKTIEVVLGKFVDVCRQINKTSDAQEIKQLVLNSINSVRQSLQFSKNGLYVILLESLHQQAKQVNKPVTFTPIDISKYSGNIITRSMQDPYQPGFHIGQINYVAPDQLQPAVQAQPAVQVSSVAQGPIKPRPTVIADCGYNTGDRGWYDAQGQGVKNDYCRRVGDDMSWFACQLAGKTPADGPIWHLTEKGKYDHLVGKDFDSNISGTNCQ